MDSGRFPEAVDAYQKALEIDPKNTDVRVDMGTCYRSAGQPDRAAEEYRKAIASNPGHPNAHRNLGIVLAFDFKNKREAIREFEEYLRVAPNAPDAQKISQLIAELKKSNVTLIIHKRHSQGGTTENERKYSILGFRSFR